MSNWLRIIWLVQGDEVYGVRRAILSLITSVQKAGWSVGLASLTDGPLARECSALGIPVIDLSEALAPQLIGGVAAKVGGSAQLLLYHRRVVRKLVEALRGLRPDGLHVLWPNLVSIAGATAKELGAPCFWEMPNILGRYPFGINRRIYQVICYHYGVVPLANSRYTAASLGSYPIRPRIMYLGVDSARFNPAIVAGISREKLGIAPDAIVLGVVARVDPAKGQDLVLQAMIALGTLKTQLHLLLLGGPLDSPFTETLRETARRSGVEDRIHLLGVTDKPEEFYAAMDVAVNFTRDAEPFGLSVIEAMMMGKPVLVHAAGGPAETVIDGVTGWHVCDASVESLSAGLHQAVSDRSCWAEMGSAARRHALEHFSLDAQLRLYMNIVEDTLQARNSES